MLRCDFVTRVENGCMRNVLAAVLLLVSAGCRTAAPSSAIAASLDGMFRELHERQLFSGAVVVSRESSLLFSAGYGLADIDRGIAFTPDTPTDGASLAKTFTADLVLRLAAARKLDLDAPVERYLPDFPYHDVTLRHLLSHSSGLLSDYGYFDAFFKPGEPRTTDAMVGVVARERPPLAFPPGSAFEYSSFAYDVAALVAARVEGTTLAELMRRRYFAPLGLTSAFLRPARLGDFPGVRTRAYEREHDEWRPNEVFEDEAFHGGSNIYISVRDLDRWNRSLLSARPPSGSLEPARVGDGISGLTYGSWYHANGGDLLWYAGHLQGFHTRMLRERSSGIAIVYTSNTTIPSWLQPAIMRAIRDVVAGRKPEAFVAPDVTLLSRSDVAQATGRWTLPGGDFTTEVRDGRLYVQQDSVTYRAFPAGPGYFYVPGLDYVLAYRRDDQTLLVSTNLELRQLRRR
jgi:CubicO group peptidase (beta-lactamase class C family)